MTERPGDGAPADPPADAQQGPSAAPPNDVPPDVAARLVQALDRAPSAFVTLIDADMRSRWLSRSATWITGTDPDSRPGRDALERIHPDDVERLVHGLAQLRAADRPAGGAGVPVLEPLRYRIRRPDDTWITVEAFVLNLLDDPVVEGLVVVGRPVGGELDGVGHVVDLLTADAPLPQVLAACANLVPHYLGPAAVVALVDDEPVVGVRSGSPAELLAVDDRWWRPVAADGRARTPADFAGFPDDLTERARTEGYRSAWTLPLTEASTGVVLGCVTVWVRIAVELNVATEHGLRQAMRLATLVIGEQRRQRALQQAAVTDPLTGVGNRSALRRRLDAARGPVTVAIVDLDRFKPVNDTHGHDVGDAVLQAVAERIVGAVREGDLVVRFGGDEFAVVFADDLDGVDRVDGVDDLDGVDGGGLGPVACRIVEAIEAPLQPAPGLTVSVGASIGVATAAPTDAVHLADTALYQVKRRKRLVTADAPPPRPIETS